MLPRVARYAQRAQGGAVALAAHETYHHELVVALGLQLHPVVRAARPVPVGRSRALGHDAFQALGAAQLEQRTPVGLEMIERTQIALAAQQLHQQRLTRKEWQRAKIEIVQRQEIEDQVTDRHFVHRRAHVERSFGVNARRDSLKARPTLTVERHDLPVQHHALGRKRGDRARDLRIAGAGGAPIPITQRDRPRVLVRHDPHAVDFQLVNAAFVHELRARHGAQHGRERARFERAAYGPERLGFGLEFTHYSRTLRQVLYGEPGQHAVRLSHEHVPRRVRNGILLLDQQPVVGFLVVRARGLAAAGGDQREAPVQFETVELEIELAELEPPLGGRLQVANATDVPDDHRACAVVALRNDLLELQVFERVVFGQHGELLVARLQARTARHGEALQGAADLQPHVVMRTRGVVQVNHEAPAASLTRTWLVFGAEGFVRTQRNRASRDSG